jgi:hypothetical protein
VTCSTEPGAHAPQRAPSRTAIVEVQKTLNDRLNNTPMIRPVCLAVIVGVMVDQIMLDGQFMAGALRMVADILAHF